MSKMKYVPDAENEVHSQIDGKAPACVVTPICTLAPAAADALTTAFANVVRTGHQDESKSKSHINGLSIVRAQNFEEGAVFMVGSPWQEFAASRYVMDFYDVTDKQICARMHYHTGMRFVRFFIGTDTSVRVGFITAPAITHLLHSTSLSLRCSTVDSPAAGKDGNARFEVILPPCSVTDMQIPAGAAHQFNATGPNAVVDTVHPEELVETNRESMSGVNMMAQTIFLRDDRDSVDRCRITDAVVQ